MFLFLVFWHPLGYCHIQSGLYFLMDHLISLYLMFLRTMNAEFFFWCDILLNIQIMHLLLAHLFFTSYTLCEIFVEDLFLLCIFTRTWIVLVLPNGGSGTFSLMGFSHTILTW